MSDAQATFNCNEPFEQLQSHQFKAGGKPSTWFPPGGLVEQNRKTKNKKQRTKEKTKRRKTKGRNRPKKKDG